MVRLPGGRCPPCPAVDHIRGRGGILGAPFRSAMAALHITDIEAAINWWRERHPGFSISDFQCFSIYFPNGHRRPKMPRLGARSLSTIWA